MAYYDFLDTVFAPLLSLPPLAAVIILALFVSLIIIVVTKYATDQKLMKSLKDEMKEHQKQLKEAKKNPQKALEIQKKSMEANMKYMMHSFRPTLITFIPIILIFGWMSHTFAFENVMPGQEFTVTANFEEGVDGTATISAPKELSIVSEAGQKIVGGKSIWRLKGDAGEHLLEIEYNNETFQKSVLISSEREVLEPVKIIENERLKTIQVNYKKLTLIPIGYKDWLGWLGTYIWSSILFTTVLRKL